MFQKIRDLYATNLRLEREANMLMKGKELADASGRAGMMLAGVGKPSSGAHAWLLSSPSLRRLNSIAGDGSRWAYPRPTKGIVAIRSIIHIDYVI